MYQGIFSSNTKALRDYVHILPWQINKIFVILYFSCIVKKSISDKFCRASSIWIRIYIVRIRLLRQPDQWMLTKPGQAERINPFPTTICFGADETDTYDNNVAPTARI